MKEIGIFVGGDFDRKDIFRSEVEIIKRLAGDRARIAVNARWFDDVYCGTRKWEDSATYWSTRNSLDINRSNVLIFDLTEYKGAGGALSELGYAIRHIQDVDGGGIVIVIGYGASRNIYVWHDSVIHVPDWRGARCVITQFIEGKTN